ncbi:MAG: hypothetical protein WCG21_07900 [Eubacteriales bacterium]
MKMKPLDDYREPEYPQLQTIEKKILSAALSGKKAATLAMAVAAAMSLTMCGTRTETTDGSRFTEPQNSTGNSTRDTADLTHAGDTTVQTWVTTAGVALIDESVMTHETALAGEIMQTEETEPTYGPDIAGSIVAPPETMLSQAG